MVTCVYVDRNCPVEDKRYMLYPYFGGDETAPHDIKIQIKKMITYRSQMVSFLNNACNNKQGT